MNKIIKAAILFVAMCHVVSRVSDAVLVALDDVAQDDREFDDEDGDEITFH